MRFITLTSWDSGYPIYANMALVETVEAIVKDGHRVTEVSFTGGDRRVVHEAAMEIVFDLREVSDE